MLVGIFALEVHSALEWPDDAAPATPAAQALNGQIGETVTPQQSAASAWRAAVLGRPLFNPSRRPPASFLAPAMQVEIPRLSGIMITPTEKIAVLSPAMGGPIIVAKNSQFGPFTVLSITTDDVTIKGPDGIAVLRSDFSYQGASGKSKPDSTMLPGGIDLDLINIPLPSAATWIGPPMVN